MGEHMGKTDESDVMAGRRLLDTRYQSHLLAEVACPLHQLILELSSALDLALSHRPTRHRLWYCTTTRRNHGRDSPAISRRPLRSPSNHFIRS